MEPDSWIKQCFVGLLVAFLICSLPAIILEASRFNSYHPISIREEQLAELRNYVWDEQRYIVVTGAKGVGKSCLINSFINKMGGVVECIVPPGIDQEAIVNKALRAVTKFLMADYFFLEYRALWSINMYKHLFQKSPLLVIRASERVTTQLKPPAELTGAVRTLTEIYGLHVIVDGSPNAVDPGLVQTGRQSVINIEPYNQDQLWSIPEFQTLFPDLDAVGLKLAVWSVLGGFPHLNKIIVSEYSHAERDHKGKLTEAGKKTLQNIVRKTLDGQIHEAINTVRSARANHPQTDTILKLFDKETLTVLEESLMKEKLVRPDPDNVLRKVYKNGKDFLVPASPAIGLVIKHSLVEVPPLEKLIELLK